MTPHPPLRNFSENSSVLEEVGFPYKDSMLSLMVVSFALKGAVLTSNPSPNSFSDSISMDSIISSCIADPDELHALLSVASAGATLTICDGDYTGWKIRVDATGVRIEAETPGKATFHGGSWFDLRGNRNTLAGIVLHGGGSDTPVQVRNQDIKLSPRFMAIKTHLRIP